MSNSVNRLAPQSWQLLRLGDIAKTTSGGTPRRDKPQYYGGSIPWVKSGELGDSVVYETEECITEEGLSSSNAKVFPKGTLCIALYGATVGKLGILGIDAATNQAVCAIFPPDYLDIRYLYRFFESKRRELVELGKGGAQSNISQGIIRDVVVPVPTLPEQQRIVGEIEKQFTRLDAGVAALKRVRANLKRYRAAVLKAACEGKLVPTEAELARVEGRSYEPGAALLQRIREDRRQKFIEERRAYLSQKANLIAHASYSVTPSLLMSSWMDEVISQDLDLKHPNAIKAIIQLHLKTDAMGWQTQTFTQQLFSWLFEANRILREYGITSDVLSNPRDLRVNKTSNSISGWLGERGIIRDFNELKLADLRQRVLIQPAEERWQLAEAKLSQPDLSSLPNLPEGWNWATIDQLAALERNSITDGPFGSNLKTEHYTDDGPRVIRLQNIGDGIYVDEVAHISLEHFQQLQKHRIFAGDLVIAGFGENPPRSCLIPDTLGPAIVKADCIRFKPHQSVLPKYINIGLNSDPVRKRTKSLVHGIGRPRLNLREIKSIILPIPPYTEQQRIVAEVERQLSVIDGIEKTVSTNLQNTERLRAAVLQQAFLGEL